MIKIGTTFSGIGAPEQTLKNLKIPHVTKWACDIDKYAKQTYLANHSCEKWYDDITKINVDELEYVDLYVFGFPCQAYSSQGLRGGLEDHRGKLIYYSLQILQEKQPKYFIAENVRGY
jgi:DNA (cytosine-5)-methyltransferase 1